MISSETGRPVCRKCGETVSGNFCSACGARLVGSCKFALEDFPLIEEPVDLVRAFWRTTRAPIAEPLRVAALTGDKSPYKFFIAGAGMFIGFFLAMQTLAKAWGVAGFTREQNQFLSVAKYAIFIHLAVAACRSRLRCLRTGCWPQSLCRVAREIVGATRRLLSDSGNDSAGHGRRYLYCDTLVSARSHPGDAFDLVDRAGACRGWPPANDAH